MPILTDEPIRHTVRELIMQSLKCLFEGSPIDSTDISWGLVSRKPLTKSEVTDHGYSLGLYDTSERVVEQTGCELRNVNVVFEFHVKLYEDDEPATYLTQCLGSVARRIGTDITLGGLVLNCRESGSELDIDGAFSNYASGIIVFDVTYRCRSNDPFTRI